jgi:hypothetical protein
LKYAQTALEEGKRISRPSHVSLHGVTAFALLNLVVPSLGLKHPPATALNGLFPQSQEFSSMRKCFKKPQLWTFSRILSKAATGIKQDKALFPIPFVPVGRRVMEDSQMKLILRNELGKSPSELLTSDLILRACQIRFGSKPTLREESTQQNI